MTNIPTDLLRTLIAVVDLRSFTKAAQTLGVTQPAVSAQVKRLQRLIGFDLLDKSAPGVSLTPRGTAVVAQARDLLSINDEIMQLSNKAAPTLRVGIPGDYSGTRMPATLARFRLRWPDLRFVVSSGSPDVLLRALRQDELDIVLAVTDTAPVIKPRHLWRRRPAWVRSNATWFDPDGPVPLVSYAEDCACQRIAIAALREAGRRCEFVFTTASLTSMAAAVAAGFGVTVMPRGRATRSHLQLWDDSPLPPLPDLHCGIYVRQRAGTTAEELADYIEADLRVEVLPGANWEAPPTVPAIRTGCGG